MSKLRNDPGYRDGWCIHYPSRGEGATCEAGVPMDRWKATPFARRPCFLDRGQSKPDAEPCECLRLPTAEEIAAHKEWANKRMETLSTVMLSIQPWRNLHKGQSFSEVVECPACNGRLHLSISAYNGHVHGRCETDGCADWME